MKPRTYTEAQYSTPAAHQMILRWLDAAEPTPEDIERVTRYLSKTLRIDGMRACRALVLGAIEATR